MTVSRVAMHPLAFSHSICLEKHLQSFLVRLPVSRAGVILLNWPDRGHPSRLQICRKFSVRVTVLHRLAWKLIPSSSPVLCMFVAQTRTHKTQETGIVLAVARWERAGREGKRQEYRREHVLRMRAQKPNKSGHEYKCNHTIENTTENFPGLHDD